MERRGKYNVRRIAQEYRKLILPDDGEPEDVTPPKTNKYGARAVEIDGVRFASALEGRRYQQLKLLLAAGEISDLVVHPRFELLARLFDRHGKVLPAVHYTGDFQYRDCRTGVVVVEDVKGGVVTEASRLRMRMLAQWHPQLDVRILTKGDM